MNMKNILVIRTHRLGDILQLTPMFQGLKSQYPEAKIYFLTGEEYVPLISGNPCIDAFIPINEKECRYILKNKTQQYFHLFNDFYDLVTGMRKINFDLIINRQYEFGAIMSYLICAQTIWGGSFSPQNGYFFEDKISSELFNLIRYDRRKNLHNLTDWSCRIAGLENNSPRRISFPVSAYAAQEARMLISSKFKANEDLIGVQMGAAKSFRQWGVKNFIPILQWLTGKMGKKIILTGSEDEKEEAAQVARMLQDNSCLDLTGKTQLDSLAAVIAHCRLFLTPDTGTMHIASAVGTPILALFYGSAYPWETGPYGAGHFILWPDLNCAPCRDPQTCSFHHQCKKELTPDIVISALEAVINSQKKGEISWQPSSRIKLLFTVSQKSEQNIIEVQGKTELSVINPEIHQSLTVNELNLNLLLLQIEDLSDLLQEDNPEKGFAAFTRIFSDFSFYQMQISGNKVPDYWIELHNKINYALINKDPVLLRDLLTYEIGPILKN